MRNEESFKPGNQNFKLFSNLNEPVMNAFLKNKQ